MKETNTKIKEIKQDIEHMVHLRSKYPYLSTELHNAIESLSLELENLEKAVSTETDVLTKE